MGFGADLLVQRQWFGGTALAFLGIALFVGEVLALAARRRPALRLTTLYALLFFPMIGLWDITISAVGFLGQPVPSALSSAPPQLQSVAASPIAGDSATREWFRG